MDKSLNGILRSKTRLGHLAIRTLLLILLVGLTIWLFIPLFMFLWFGSGQYATQVSERPLTAFLTWLLPLLLGLGLAFWLFHKNIRQGNVSKAKNLPHCNGLSHSCIPISLGDNRGSHSAFSVILRFWPACAQQTRLRRARRANDEAAVVRNVLVEGNLSYGVSVFEGWEKHAPCLKWHDKVT